MPEDTNTLTPETASPATCEPRTTPSFADESAFLTRAERILAGNIRAEDYLTVPEAIRSAVANEAVRLIEDMGFKISDEFGTRMRNDWTLQFIHGGQPVACRRTDVGVIVFAVGTEEIRTLLERFPRPDQRSGFFITTPPPWQTPNPTDSPNHSPQRQHHSE
jgi:hypothetical protein